MEMQVCHVLFVRTAWFLILSEVLVCAIMLITVCTAGRQCITCNDSGQTDTSVVRRKYKVHKTWTQRLQVQSGEEQEGAGLKYTGHKWNRQLIRCENTGHKTEHGFRIKQEIQNKMQLHYHTTVSWTSPEASVWKSGRNPANDTVGCY